MYGVNVWRLGENRQDDPRRLDEADSIDALLDLLRADFEQHAYFVTGDICEGIYQQDCFYGDPTVSFIGLQRWRSNLQLLVPFLEQPRIILLSLAADPQARMVQAEWRLITRLRLPWQPRIDILGATEYTLDASCTKIERHIESWSVSGTEALAMIFRPARRHSAGCSQAP
ncbi:hypothetical protein WJX81_003813 [Elliptochloris bilobata]|uniref:Uncharacterized protein n=1 Tax=Elliptochloris bilobata TaxID=381761 RepID=A0AAW1QIQ8_9CHLO